MAPGQRSRLTAAARRVSILAVAIPEFAAAGYDRTRVSDIAAKVGVTEPVIFQNFGTKSDLFVGVLEQATNELVGYLAMLREQSRNVAELLSVLLGHELQDRMHAGGGLGAMFAKAAANSSAPSIRRAGHRAHDRIRGAVAGLLRRGQAEGSIRSDVDATALGWLVISQIHARQFRRAHGQTSHTLEDAWLRALVAALRPPEAKVSQTRHQARR